MSKPNAPWFSMNTSQKQEEIYRRRIQQQSFAEIARDLLGDEKNKSTIWSWARRNMDEEEIYPGMSKLPSRPYGEFSEVQQWIMFDIISSLFPRLDALSEHLLVEIQKIDTEQREKFMTTAGFLDNLETRIIEAIRRNTTFLSTRVTSTISTSSPPPIPTSTVSGAPPPPPPPPPPSSILPTQERVSTGPISTLNTNFEEMSMEEITAIPQEFLEALTPADRNKLQERVKELKSIEKMAPEERELYLQKKVEEKERTAAVDGLGDSLTAMLDDSDSLFARMRHAADESQVSGSGTFGKFTTDYVYFYCFVCGKINRSEDETISECEYCGAEPDQLVLDEEKSNYTYWECLVTKKREYVDLNYSRGKQIVVRSRWKTPVGEPLDQNKCDSKAVREITSAVLVKADPDKQFSHYLTLFRLYDQLNLKCELKVYLRDLAEEIQKLVDLTSKEEVISHGFIINTKINLVLNWLDDKGNTNDITISKGIMIQIENLKQDLKLLIDPDSPQELGKASEVGYVLNKMDQLLNKFTTIITELEQDILLPQSWKCSECDNVFEIRDRYNVPERCGACGKIITKLVSIDN